LVARELDDQQQHSAPNCRLNDAADKARAKVDVSASATPALSA
jgi:hypothetical protein